MNPLLADGLTDAIGFFAGGLIAYTIAKLLGFDPMAAGMEGGTLVGIAMAGIGGGAGVQTARRLRAARRKKDE